MILYNLKCRKDHVFEAWFRNSASYEEQAAGGGVACPLCGSRKVEKALMAPRLSKGSSARSGPTESSPAESGPAEGSPADDSTGPAIPDSAGPEAAQAVEALKTMRALRRKIEENCDYVGPRFAEEARKIHYGESDPKNIYGESSDEEAKELHDEGIKFARIPWPARQDS